MDAVAARYPFLSTARAAVEEADVDLGAVVRADDSPIIEHAVERIEGAIRDGRVPDPAADPERELLSYPMARVLVSLVNEPVLTDRYALAEARRAMDLLASDQETAGLRSTGTESLTREDLLAELELADRIVEAGDGHTLAVTTFLGLTSDLRDSSWRLVERRLAEGRVRIDTDELDVLLREAVRHRVRSDLPLEVPEEIADELAAQVDAIVGLLADVRLPTDIDVVSPAQFPPCLAALVDRIRGGESVRPIERFTVVSFLCAIGLAADELPAFLAVDSTSDERTLEYMASHVCGESSATAYPPPSCETLEALDVCVDVEDRCLDAGHLLIGYQRRLGAAADVTDWREA